MALERYLNSGRTFVIAEIGTAHQGDRPRALELIDAAADSGADCVKTQVVYADEIVHRKTGLVELPGGAVPLWERFRELEVDPQLFADMASRCKERGVLFLASCFGERSLADLRALGSKIVKIASPELNHYPLLETVRKAGLDVVLSTGVATLGDIDAALGRLQSVGIALMHCVTAYPAPPEDYNLLLLQTLPAVFGVAVGVSDHSLDPILVPATAAALGAACIEKHFSLERSGGGLDDPIALEPQEFREMVDAIREAESAGRSEALGTLEKRYGSEQLKKVIGNGVKRLAPSEAANYGSTNRSILAVRDIQAGEPIGPQNAAILRSEKNLTPGLPPREWPVVLGARAAVPIQDGEGIRWEQLLFTGPNLGAG